MTKLEAYRFAEEFLDGVAARGETLEDARRKLSAFILMFELHDLDPDLSDETIVAAGLKFHEEDWKMIFSDLIDRAVEDARTAARVPMPVNNQPTDAHAIGDLIQSYKSAGKPVAHDINTDAEIEKRVAHVLKRGEKLGQFYSRTLLGRAAILTMSKEEITRAVALAEANRAEEPLPPPELFEPKRLPARFTLLDTFAD